MPLQETIKSPIIRLIGSSAIICGAVCLTSVTAGSTTPILVPVILKSGIDILDQVFPEIFGSAFDEYFLHQKPKDEFLDNEDLIKAIGKTIFRLCKDAEDEAGDLNDKETFQILSKIYPESWKDLAFGGTYKEGYGLSFSGIDLESIMPGNITQYFQAKESEIDDVKTLSPGEWEAIIEAICRNKNCSLSDDGKKRISNKLYNNFSQAFRATLAQDFKEDGNAYANMQFRILSELLYYAKENTQLSINNNNILAALNEKVESLISDSKNRFSTEDYKGWEKFLNDFELYKPTWDKTLENSEIARTNSYITIKNTSKIIEKVDGLQAILTSKPNPQPLNPAGLINFTIKESAYFVEQGNIFVKIEEQLTANHIASFHGIHGLGKTTTAVQYAYKVKDDYETIIFILATEENIEQEMARLAERFVEGAKDVKEQRVKALMFKEFLESQKNWLVIFDNLESREQIANYFPNSSNVDVLYTCNENLYIGKDCKVTLDEFSQIEAELFLYQKVNDNPGAKNTDIAPSELEQINSVLEALGRLPLALNIAGAYIKKNSITYRDYLNYFEKALEEVLKLKDSHGIYQHETLFAAFTVSLDKVKSPKDDSEKERAKAKLAEAFLNICAFCAPEEIPGVLIGITLFRLISTETLPTPKEILWKETVTLLKDFDLIKEFAFEFEFLLEGNNKYSFFNIHRSLQNVLFIKLNEDERLNLIQNLTFVLLNFFPEDLNNIYDVFEKFIPHGQNLLKITDRLEIENRQNFTLYNYLSFYLYSVARYTEAESFYVKAVAISENLFGKEHPETAQSYNNLAELYREQARYTNAEPLYEQALAISKQVLGDDHVDTARIYNNLALLYAAQGKYELVEISYQKVIKIFENIPGDEMLLADTYNNLAEFYRNSGKQDKYEEAESLYKKSLLIREQHLASDHPKIGQSYNNLALLYLDQSKSDQSMYEKAESLLRKALTINKSVLGGEHPETSSTYNNLAQVYYLQGKFEEAKPLFEKALIISKKTLGESHPDTAQSYMNLGVNYYFQKNYQVALTFIKKALVIYQNVLPPEHEETGLCTNWVKTIENAII